MGVLLWWNKMQSGRKMRRNLGSLPVRVCDGFPTYHARVVLAEPRPPAFLTRTMPACMERDEVIQ